MKKNKKTLILVLGLLAGAGLIIFLLLEFFLEKDQTVIKKLAHDAWTKVNPLVYVLENETYEPYVVVTKDYFGKTLLMRKFVLDENRPFNDYDCEDGDYSLSYFKDSLIDKFLSEDFYNSLSSKTKELISPVDIDITTKESIISGPVLESEKLNRKVFLLSAYEVGGTISSLEVKEGKKLSYFEKTENCIGYYKNGSPGFYWLRTAHTWSNDTVMILWSFDGGTRFMPIDSELAVRPVFCLEGSTPVFKKEVKGRGQVYVLE